MALADEAEDLKKKLAESKKKAQEAEQRFLTLRLLLNPLSLNWTLSQGLLTIYE